MAATTRRTERDPADGSETSTEQRRTANRTQGDGAEDGRNPTPSREGSSEDLSDLRCSSLQTEEVQKREKRRERSAGYPGLAFGSPMFSGTIFKFNLIANELRDLKHNQLKKAESEVTALNRRIQLIEEELEKSEERFRVSTQKLDEAHQAIDESERVRKLLENKTNLEDDRISYLEAQLAQARQIAEDSDKKYEEMARRIAMLEADLERAEERASKAETKNIELEKELVSVGNNLKSLEANQEKCAQREEVYETQIKSVQAKLKEAEVRAEVAERTVHKLRTEVDRLEDELSGEREKSHLLQEEVETTLKDLQSIIPAQESSNGTGANQAASNGKLVPNIMKRGRGRPRKTTPEKTIAKANTKEPQQQRARRGRPPGSKKVAEVKAEVAEVPKKKRGRPFKKSKVFASGKRRGRPPKVKILEEGTDTESNDDTVDADSDEDTIDRVQPVEQTIVKAARSRGRPRKQQPPVAE